MELTSPSHVVLGMLQVGSRSGYEIKRSVELSARFFWAISPVQIYPALKRLEKAGLAVGRDDPNGGRSRRLYELTEAGHHALREWLLAPGELTVEWRDAGLLKLFFADALEPEEALERVRAFRKRAERLLDQFEGEVCPAGEKTRQRHSREFPLIVARFGRDYNAWVIEWCDQLELELGLERRASARSEPRKKKPKPKPVSAN